MVEFLKRDFFKQNNQVHPHTLPFSPLILSLHANHEFILGVIDDTLHDPLRKNIHVWPRSFNKQSHKDVMR